MTSLLQWRNLLERLTRFRLRPIRLEFGPVKNRPLANQLQRRFRVNVADDHLTAEVELAVLPLMLGVEVCRVVLLVVHPHDNAEERRDDGHDAVYRRRRGAARLAPAEAPLLGSPIFDPDVGYSAV